MHSWRQDCYEAGLCCKATQVENNSGHNRELQARYGQYGVIALRNRFYFSNPIRLRSPANLQSHSGQSAAHRSQIRKNGPYRAPPGFSCLKNCMLALGGALPPLSE